MHRALVGTAMSSPKEYGPASAGPPSLPELLYGLSQTDRGAFAVFKHLLDKEELDNLRLSCPDARLAVNSAVTHVLLDDEDVPHTDVSRSFPSANNASIRVFRHKCIDKLVQACPGLWPRVKILTVDIAYAGDFHVAGNNSAKMLLSRYCPLTYNSPTRLSPWSALLDVDQVPDSRVAIDDQSAGNASHARIHSHRPIPHAYCSGVVVVPSLRRMSMLPIPEA
jgi:hypothetical protein